MNDLIAKAAEMLAKTRHVIALTGAGISVESGIPPFRGPGGLWEKFDPMEVGHIRTFMKDPARVWNTLMAEMRGVLKKAVPNSAHTSLARLEELSILKTVITQNIDGLHQKAGNTDVIEFHGNFAWLTCMDCGNRKETISVNMDVLPPRCECGGIFRPDCVFFGEAIPEEALIRSREEARACEVMLVVGTSAIVQPAAFMPMIAHQSGAKIIEINPEPTPLTESVSTFIIQKRAGEALTAIMAEIEKRAG
ncbi:MAG: NAD-dependent deacylase [Deltaproteobacteria bacterium]|nr:NAD-dependent deacylase [Deltaproteobacteria bacterium]